MNEDLRHGGALDRMREAFPEAPKPWIDLSTGINPWAYPHTEVTEEALNRLPTRAAYSACQRAMAAAIGAPPETLLLAPGSELLIRLLPDVISAKRVTLLAPSYGDHAVSWKRAGVTIVNTTNPLEMADETDVVIVCNPNNPDGHTFSVDALNHARDKLAARRGWLIIDEAYADLDPGLSLAPLAGSDGLIILRSFGKFFGLAGVRLGALIAPASIRDAMAARLGVWPVSGAALEIGTRAYADTRWQSSSRTSLKSGAARLDESLEGAGLGLVGGTDLFRFVETADAHGVFERLAQAGVYVRRFDWSTRHLRIGLPATQTALERLEAALIL
ncbi:MAG: threonine-phosphate decarboxylase CobD [Pseudomonadota bacterium]